MSFDRKWLVLPIFLSSIACSNSTQTVNAKSSASSNGIAVKVNGVPIERAEIERLAKFFQSFNSNYAFEYCCAVVLGNSLLPRAATISHFQEQVESLKLKIGKIRERATAGEDFVMLVETEGIPSLMEEEDKPGLRSGYGYKMDVLLTEWLYSLAPGEISPPILTQYGWQILKLGVDRPLGHQLRMAIPYYSVLLPLEEGLGPAKIHEFLEQAKIEIIDPECERWVPEWAKFGPGLRKMQEAAFSGNTGEGK